MTSTIRIYLNIWLFKQFKGLQAEITGSAIRYKSSSKCIFSFWLKRRHDIIFSPWKITNRHIRQEISGHHNLIASPVKQNTKEKLISFQLDVWSEYISKIYLIKVRTKVVDVNYKVRYTCENRVWNAFTFFHCIWTLKIHHWEVKIGWEREVFNIMQHMLTNSRIETFGSL